MGVVEKSNNLQKYRTVITIKSEICQSIKSARLARDGLINWKINDRTVSCQNAKRQTPKTRPIANAVRPTTNAIKPGICSNLASAKIARENQRQREKEMG